MPFRGYRIAPVDNFWARFGRVGLLFLIVGTLYLDFVHGVFLGQHHQAFGPIYRTRQSLAVAVSRLHAPAPGGYLAYKSVTNALSEGGFAIFPGDPASQGDVRSWSELLKDGAKVDRILQRAKDIPIDATLPPDIIAGNELGYADYIYLSFRLFGTEVSSLYYFWFLLIAISCSLYVVQFIRRPFFLFLLAIYLAEVYLLQSYALSKGTELNTVANSRLFSALSLLPACHILFVLWQAKPLALWQGALWRMFTIAAVTFQSAFFAFLLSCRTEIAWQFAMIMATAAITGIYLLRAQPLSGGPGLLRRARKRLTPLWPAGVLLLFVVANLALVSLTADKRYALEPKAHIIWHEVLMGILSSNMELRREYVGDDPNTYSDNEVYTAVIKDLNARNDSSSPISRIENGHITIDLMRGWGEYDRLVRSFALRVIRDHPFQILASLPVKARDQLDWYTSRRALAPANLLVPAILIAFAALSCAATSAFYTDKRSLRSGSVLLCLILVFAAVTPSIEPNHLAVGTLFCYLAVIAIFFCYLGLVLARAVGWLRQRFVRKAPSPALVDG
jgi:hypothetical protein